MVDDVSFLQKGQAFQERVLQYILRPLQAHKQIVMIQMLR